MNNNTENTLKLIKSAKLQNHKLKILKLKHKKLKTKQNVNKMINDKKDNKHLPITKNSNNKKKCLRLNNDLYNLIAGAYKEPDYEIRSSNNITLNNLQILTKIGLVNIAKSKKYKHMGLFNIRLTPLGESFANKILKLELIRHDLKKSKVYNIASDAMLQLTLIIAIMTGLILAPHLCIEWSAMIVEIIIGTILSLHLTDKAFDYKSNSKVPNPKISKCLKFLKNHVSHKTYGYTQKILIKTAQR